jgi:hypothetical protein
MSDDTDLLFAAAATAALVTWMGTRHRAQRRAHREWAAHLAAFRAGLLRSWREAPGYVFIQAVKELFKRH